jgi:hypothetical protein
MAHRKLIAIRMFVLCSLGAMVDAPGVPAATKVGQRRNGAVPRGAAPTWRSFPLNAFSRPGRGIGEIGGNPAFTSVKVLLSHAMTSSALAIIAFRVGAQAFAGDQS